MPSSKPAAKPESAAALFYAGHRSALLGDPAVTEKKMFGTTALCAGGKVFLFPWRDTLVVSASDRWPRLAQAARAFAAG